MNMSILCIVYVTLIEVNTVHVRYLKFGIIVSLTIILLLLDKKTFRGKKFGACIIYIMYIRKMIKTRLKC